MVEALCHEIILQKEYLKGELVDTIYFGGGTPSLLTPNELQRIVETIHATFSVSELVEITLEANPDDLTIEGAHTFQSLGVNRLSIGIQSFNAERLHYLNRIHSEKQAINSMEIARQAGFTNISIDLMYGIPSKNNSIWENDLSTAIKLQPEHISAYCLTIEEKTAFGQWVKQGKIKRLNDDVASNEFYMMTQLLSDSGYHHYEVSNFARNTFYSKHNSNYWKQKKYLGVGPGAHSYNQKTRQFNISNNAHYIKALDRDDIPCTIEYLTPENFVNEYILTSLRTIWGIDFNSLKERYDYNLEVEKSEYIHLLKQQGMINIRNGKMFLTTKGFLLADSISSELFVNNDNPASTQ